MPAIALLSGGFDSTIALFWALNQEPLSSIHPVDGMTIHYGQSHRLEVNRAGDIWAIAQRHYSNIGALEIVQLPPSILAGNSSLLGRSEIASYTDVQEAQQHNQSDTAYIPVRNAIFLTIAANHLLAKYPDGGWIIPGFRGRPGPGGGFPDGSPLFSDAMSHALSIGAATSVQVVDPLNRPGRSRLDALRLADTFDGCWEALAYSLTCFRGQEPPCGHCLPCLRRAEAFEQYGREDPAIERLRHDRPGTIPHHLPGNIG